MPKTHKAVNICREESSTVFHIDTFKLMIGQVVEFEVWSRFLWDPDPSPIIALSCHSVSPYCCWILPILDLLLGFLLDVKCFFSSKFIYRFLFCICLFSYLFIHLFVTDVWWITGRWTKCPEEGSQVAAREYRWTNSKQLPFFFHFSSFFHNTNESLLLEHMNSSVWKICPFLF